MVIVMNLIYQKCDICNKRHKEIKDIYEWYGHFLDHNPKNTDVEIWDMKKKIWVKRKD